MKFIVTVFNVQDEALNHHLTDTEPSVDDVQVILAKYPDGDYARVEKRLYKTEVKKEETL